MYVSFYIRYKTINVEIWPYYRCSPVSSTGRVISPIPRYIITRQRRRAHTWPRGRNRKPAISTFLASRNNATKCWTRTRIRTGPWNSKTWTGQITRTRTCWNFRQTKRTANTRIRRGIQSRRPLGSYGRIATDDITSRRRTQNILAIWNSRHGDLFKQVVNIYTGQGNNRWDRISTQYTKTCWFHCGRQKKN